LAFFVLSFFYFGDMTIGNWQINVFSTDVLIFEILSTSKTPPNEYLGAFYMGDI